MLAAGSRRARAGAGAFAPQPWRAASDRGAEAKVEAAGLRGDFLKGGCFTWTNAAADRWYLLYYCRYFLKCITKQSSGVRAGLRGVDTVRGR